MQVRKQFTENVRKLKIRNFSNFLGRFFKPWYKMTETRQSVKFRLIRQRAFRILIKAYKSLKIYTKASRYINSKIEKIVKIRANNLLKLAFNSGFVSHNNDSKIKTK
jgi:hypothetical protein